MSPRRQITAVDIHRHCAATGTADDDIRLVLIVLGLSDADSLVEVVVGEGRIQNLVAVLTEEGRLEAARR